MPIIKQINNLINDSFKDAVGSNQALTELDTSTVVSMGSTIDKFDLYEGFYKSLVNRIVRTIYFVRAYSAKRRSVMRDEHEFGAFVQKVYYKMPEAVEDPAFNVTTDAQTYTQHSPYDVEKVVAVESKVYGGQGVFSYEFITPIVQIKTAFTSDAAMMSFINGIYTTVNSKMEKDIEDLQNVAVATAIASAMQGGQSRNLLKEYNTAHADGTLTVAQALESLDFLKFASKEINLAVDYMQDLTTVYNGAGYETFTPRENMVVEELNSFAKAADYYLQSDTYHNTLTQLPRYEEVTYWQGRDKDMTFDIVSGINVKNDGLVSEEPSNPTGVVTAKGIIAFIHDTENVACYFGERRSWTLPNQRDDILIHGEKARKGYAVDNHANAVVFYLAEEE